MPQLRLTLVCTPSLPSGVLPRRHRLQLEQTTSAPRRRTHVAMLCCEERPCQRNGSRARRQTPMKFTTSTFRLERARGIIHAMISIAACTRRTSSGRKRGGATMRWSGGSNFARQQRRVMRRNRHLGYPRYRQHRFLLLAHRIRYLHLRGREWRWRRRRSSKKIEQEE